MNRKNSSLESQTDWKKIDAMDDSDIDFSDIPELTEEQLSQMKPTRHLFAERGINYEASTPKSVTVIRDDGTTVQHRLAPESNMVLLDSDVIKHFADSAAVNRALRGLIELIPQS